MEGTKKHLQAHLFGNSYWGPQSLGACKHVDDTAVAQESYDEQHSKEEAECILDQGVLGRKFAPMLVHHRSQIVGEIIQHTGS